MNFVDFGIFKGKILGKYRKIGRNQYFAPLAKNGTPAQRAEAMQVLKSFWGSLFASSRGDRSKMIFRTLNIQFDLKKNQILLAKFGYLRPI